MARFSDKGDPSEVAVVVTHCAARNQRPAECWIEEVLLRQFPVTTSLLEVGLARATGQRVVCCQGMVDPAPRRHGEAPNVAAILRFCEVRLA